MARFDRHLKGAGYLAMGGQIINASIISAQRQRMTGAEREIVKGGGVPDAWMAKPARLAQKDRDARWTLKPRRAKRKPDGALMAPIATPIFGYKSHICIDQRHCFIRRWRVSDAARSDGRELPGLLDRANTASNVWADTAYRSVKTEKRIARRGTVSKVHFRKLRRRPMPVARQKANAARSKIRAAVEPVFADRKHRMGLFVRTVGIERATTRIGLPNLAYTFRRLAFLESRPALA